MIIYFSIGLSFLVLSFFIAILKIKRGYKTDRIIAPFHCIFAGTIIALIVFLYPLYHINECNWFLALCLSIQNALQIFTINSDISSQIETILADGSQMIKIYAGFLSFFCVFAPFLTFGFVLSFFKGLLARIKLISSINKDIYIFSDLNDKSLYLAKSIINDSDKKAVIVFNDVFNENEETSYELIEKAKELGALMFKKDIVAINYKLYYKYNNLVFFVISSDETENINQSLKLIVNYKNLKRKDKNPKKTDKNLKRNDKNNNKTDWNLKEAELYVFSTRSECNILLENAGFGNMRVKRINEVRLLINYILYKKGYEMLFQDYKVNDDCIASINGTVSEKNPEGKKVNPKLFDISAVIVGLGKHGTEMIKALTWYCQIPGCNLKINAFDLNDDSEDILKSDCPDLFSDEYNHQDIFGDARYDICVHKNINVETIEFEEVIKSIKDITYVFICLGDDELNISTAVNMRMTFERMGIDPKIQTIVYNAAEKNALCARRDGIVNWKQQPYNIEFIGDIESMYSHSVVINSELNSAALDIHLNYLITTKASDSEIEAGKDDFWRYSYLYQSSIASAIHRELRKNIFCSKYDDKSKEEMQYFGRVTEHMRWNAYTRSIGYIWNGDQNKYSGRNDLARIHNLLCTYDDLPEKEKQKDD